MSWSATVKAVPKEEFEAAIDALPVPTQGHDTDGNVGIEDDFAAAKAVAKELAKRITRPLIGVSMGGHTLQPGQENFSEGINVSVYGSLTPGW